jgi:ribosomal protein L29
MKKIFMLCVILITCSSCSEFALLASGSSLAISQNTYAKMYNVADVLTIMRTEESIKKHAYSNMKKVIRNKTLENIERKKQKLLAELEQLRKGKKYIYDKTWGLTNN